MALSPEQRRLRASGAAYTRWSREDPRPAMEKARAGRLARLEQQVDPEGLLPSGERRRRAQAALKAHMRMLSLASSRSRAARKVSK